MQVRRCQDNGGKGIPAAGLHADTHVLAQLVMDGGNLGFGGRDGHGGLRVRLSDLAVHPLDHGLIVPLRGLEDFNELLGADVIGKGPQPLSRSAGQEDDVHNRVPACLYFL